MSTGRITVLIVDDEPMIVRLLDEVLGEEGYATLTASDGGSALERLAAHRVDVVVTDTMMPYVSGLDLVQAIRERPTLVHIPVILTSAAPAPNLTGVDVFAFLPKPFDLERFLGLVDAASGRRAT